MTIPAGGDEPIPGDLPEWAPTLGRVAIYVPHRTLAKSVLSITGSQDEYRFTFDQTTTPPASSVLSLIADGVAWVSALVTPLHVTSQPLASLVAALWAAISLERAWPNDDQSLQRANDMEKQLNTMLAALITANNRAWDEEEGEGEYALDVLPVWSFPVPDLRYDDARYW
ncbi:hypothetical protein [Paractinoplanes maris]|uniref:hypothetical protein n=1 Tax=Paractinoplanes maris TaxID=1734446 RepID=UPI0020220BF0|nr:hypothetical protein [Actinoplanes maris]